MELKDFLIGLKELLEKYDLEVETTKEQEKEEVEEIVQDAQIEEPKQPEITFNKETGCYENV